MKERIGSFRWVNRENGIVESERETERNEKKLKSSKTKTERR